MKTGPIPTIGLAFVVVCVVAAVLLNRRHETPKADLATARTTVKPSPVKVEPLPMPPAEPVVEVAAPVAPAKVVATPKPERVAPATNQTAGLVVAPRKSGKPPIVDPDAREALALVGVDPEAEEYWLSAINDLSLPANERKDLIEDLNEDGLSDPKNPGPDDLPIILSRIELLRHLYPRDQVNADAIKEAYKDLDNLARLASGRGGDPVN